MLARWYQIASLGRLLFLRDLRFRYRQAFFGYLWAVARVLFTGLPMILVGNQFNLGGERTGLEYALFALTGLILWQIFWDSVIYPQWVSRRLRRTLVEAGFPREALIAAGVGYVVFNGSMYLMLIAAAFLVFQITPPATAVLGLLAIPALIMSGVAIGTVFVPLSLVYLDFRYGLPMLSPVLLWTAPIFYEAPQTGLLAILNRWNPVTYLITSPRSWMVSGPTDADLAFFVCLGFFAMLFLATLRFFRAAMPLSVGALPR